MSEIKGLLWWNLGQTTLIMTVGFFLLGVKMWAIWYMFGVATFDTIIGILEYFGIMDKIKRKKNV